MACTKHSRFETRGLALKGDLSIDRFYQWLLNHKAQVRAETCVQVITEWGIDGKEQG